MMGKELKEKITELLDEYSDVQQAEEIVSATVEAMESEWRRQHKPVYDLDDFSEYKRHLIQLRPDTAILLHIFTRDIDQNLETAWLDDNDEYYEADFECIKDSAHQLLLQLEGHWCDAFIEALRDECNDILKHSEERKRQIDENIRSKQSAS